MWSDEPAGGPSDHRKARRITWDAAACIRELGGEREHGCQVLDLSNRGARIRLVAERQVPDLFILVLSSTGTLSRACRVIWRRGSDIGVEFTAAPLQEEPGSEGIGEADWTVARPSA